MALPLRTSPTAPARSVTIEVLQRFEFEPHCELMSGVIAQERWGLPTAAAQPQVLLKGSHFDMAKLLPESAFPAGWGQVRHPQARSLALCASQLFLHATTLPLQASVYA